MLTNIIPGLSEFRAFFEIGYKLSKHEPERGIYAGAYVYQSTDIGCSMQKFNQLTGKKHASFFKYVGYGTLFP